uniref:Uncharacterized protein n=1 Tax=Romanomermis culicivorax TaxID=13658 RepID=A0A915JLA2_ROMCU
MTIHSTRSVQLTNSATFGATIANLTADDIPVRLAARETSCCNFSNFACAPASGIVAVSLMLPRQGPPASILTLFRETLLSIFSVFIDLSIGLNVISVNSPASYCCCTFRLTEWPPVQRCQIPGFFPVFPAQNFPVCQTIFDHGDVWHQPIKSVPFPIMVQTGIFGLLKMPAIQISSKTQRLMAIRNSFA